MAAAAANARARRRPTASAPSPTNSSTASSSASAAPATPRARPPSPGAGAASGRPCPSSTSAAPRGRSPTSAVALVDGALAGYSAPTLRLLDIDVCDARLAAATHVAPWLRFAAGRVAGELSIRLRSGRYGDGAGEEEVLDLPVCGAATAIRLRLVSHLRLRPPPGGAFAALATATIQSCRVDGGELGCLVSSPQCPRLEELYLINVALVAASDVAISSTPLRRLRFGVRDTRRLDVDAPELRFLSVSNAGEACVTAGKVEEVAHTGDMDRYEYTQLGRHLRRLDIDLTSTMAAFLGRLDTVGELSLHLAFQSELSDVRRSHNLPSKFNN